MCTVSFIYKGGSKFILTSNRDESPLRKTIAPMQYEVSETKMIFPKDTLAGGTWIGMSKKNRVVCLLNGGFEKHTRLPEYRHSRGVVVKDFLQSDAIESTVDTYNLQQIEPFTIVIVDWTHDLQLFELVWDGTQKHFQKLPLTSHIWSSSTLYTNAMKKMRQNWFADFLQKNETSKLNLLDFHKNGGIGDLNVDTIMDRGFVKTVSITQVEKTTDDVFMDYHSLTTSKSDSISFKIAETVYE